VETLDELEAAGCVIRPLDVTEDESARAVVEEITDAHGAVGALVNNAGYGEYGPVEEVSIERWRRQFETNVFGVVRMCQLVLPGMREAGRGRIITVSSMGGRMTLPGGGAYHASKYAVESLSDALRFEVRGFGVRVSLIEPGPVTTDFVEEAATPSGAEGAYAAFGEAVARSNAAAYGAGRGASSPQDIARVIEQALSSARPRARYLIGATARGLVTARGALGARGFDAVLRTQLPTPSGR
jgi:NAD(P)-dependent dehydrogenase (short-subunit alcohol dehydrogenase family)